MLYTIAAMAGLLPAMFAIVAPAPAQAATGVNQQINYQGRLLTAGGRIVPDGYYNIQFKIYQDGGGCIGGGSSPCGGTLKWTETWDYNGGSPDNRARVVNGYFSVRLGSINPFGSSVDWNQDTLWLSVNIGGPTTSPSYDGEMLPFKRLTAVPYALNTQLFDGKPSTGFIVNDTVTQTAANFNIQSAAAGSVGGVIQGANGQTADLLQLKSFAGATLASISSTGAITSVGLNAGTGLIQGTGGLTIGGTVTLSNLSTAGIVTNTAAGVIGTVATLPIAQGGTNATTAQGAINNLAGLTTAGDLLYHDGANATRLPRGTSGQCLTSTAGSITWGSCGGSGSFTLAGSSGTPQTIASGDTLTIAAGSNITTTAGATDTVTVAVVSSPSFTSVNAVSGYQQNGSATAGTFLRGNGSFYVSSTIQSSDIPSGSGYYIHNGTSLQTSANFNIQSAAAGSTVANIRGATSQTAPLLVAENSDGSDVLTVYANTTTKVVVDSVGFDVQNASSVDVFTVDVADGQIGVNNSAPSHAIDVYNPSGEDTSTILQLRNNSSAYGSQVTGTRSRGTRTSPTAILNDDTILNLAAAGYNGSAYTNTRGNVRISAAENWSASNNGTKIDFFVTRNTTAVNPTRVMVINNDGSVATTSLANSSTAFQVQNASGSGVLTVSTADGSLSSTGYINSSTGFRVAGAATSGTYLRGNGTNFVASTIQAGDIPTLTGYINNSTGLQTSANFSIQSASAASAVGALRGAVSQTGNLLQMTNSGGTILASFSAAGALTAVGVNSGSGQIQGTGGFSLTDGAFTVNIGSNNATINSNSTVTLNNSGTGTVVIGNNASGNVTIAGTGTISIGANSAYPTISIGTTGGGTTNINSASVAIRGVNLSFTSLTAGTTGNVVCRITATSQIVQGPSQTSCLSSSERYKDNIVTMTDSMGLPAINQLRPVTFTYKADSTNRQYVGLIAEEVSQVLPNLVEYDELGRPNALNYELLTANLVKGIQQQQAQIEALDSRLQAVAGTTDLMLGAGSAHVSVGDANDTQTTQLVLDSQSRETEPVDGIDGGMYYNAAQQQFRCFRDGAWETCGVNPIDRGFVIEDEFAGGNGHSATGTPVSELSWGSAGWTASCSGAAGTAAPNGRIPGSVEPTGDRIGILSFRAVGAGNGCLFALNGGDSSTRSASLAANQTVKTSVALGAATSATSLNFRVGLLDSAAAEIPTTGVYWKAGPESANWQYCYIDGSGSAVCGDSYVPVVGNEFASLSIKIASLAPAASSITFTINGAVKTLTGVDINTDRKVSPAFGGATASSGAAGIFNIDYYQFSGIASARR